MLKEKKFEKYSTICYITAIALIVITLGLFFFQYLHVSYTVRPIATYDYANETKSFNIELVSSDGTPATFEFDKNTGDSNIADLRVKSVVYKNGSYVINEQYEESYCSAYGEEKANTFTVNTYYAPTQKYVKFDLEFDTESCKKYLGEQSTARAFFLITEYPNDFKQEFTGYSMILNESRDFRVAGFLTLLILIMFGIILLSIALGFFSSRKEATGKSLISVNVFMIIVIILSFILMGFIYTKLEYKYSGRDLGTAGGKFHFESISTYNDDLTYGMTAVPVIGFFVSIAAYVVFRIYAAKGKYKV